ncbi:hypothetical protein ITJ38_17765 [Agreia pratensis]|uniref:hypothetical protein n=1 Tax=Agreia pratensis TaxID=150121 RepID=UPI00188C5DAF|nr:hypothetical protein [Agreia pratensis]MBF4636262.1 hypothetical protein [Agreia pratensis]
MTKQLSTISPTRTNAHSKSIGDEIDDILATLVRVLGKQAIADITKKSVRTVQRWIDSKPASIGDTDQKVLRDTFMIYTLLSEADGDHTVRAWFLGMNPVLDDLSPIEVLVEGRARAVSAAARAFVNGA